MTTFSIPMKFHSEKKHSVRYDAASSDEAISTVYVMKKYLPSDTGYPKQIIIKLEVDAGW